MLRGQLSGSLLLVGLLVLAGGARAQENPPAAEGDREIRIAVFDLDAVEGVDIESETLTDQVVTLLAAMDGVRLINRAELAKVAEEQKIALSGLVDADSAVRLGRFVSAQYIVTGRASRIGQTNYIVVKLIDVETTVQSTAAAKASVDDGFPAVLERLAEALAARIGELQAPPKDEDRALAELKPLVQPLDGKVFLVNVSEEHVSRPLRDPAAAMAISHRLSELGLTAIVPEKPIEGWRQHLLETGRFGEQKVDYLIEGEGVSGFGGQIQGLTSCRARVELRIIAVPGRTVQATDRGVGAGVDLVEALAAKTALEDAGTQALDATLKRLVAGDEQREDDDQDR